MNRAELQQLAEMRLSDAKQLLTSGQNDAGAYYMAGYAVECAIKAVIAKNQGEYPYPDFSDARFKKERYYSHDVAVLVQTANLYELLKQDRLSNALLDSNWTTVERWNETVRYRTTVSRQEADDIILAIEEPANGALLWLMNYW